VNRTTDSIRLRMLDADEVATLVRCARRGERSAFDALVRAHVTAVYSFLHRLVGNPEDAEDLAQETFVRAHAALASYRDDARFSTWLLRIAHHLAIDHRRASGRAHRAASFSSVDDAALAEAFLRAPRQRATGEPGELAQRAELTRALARALDEL